MTKKAKTYAARLLDRLVVLDEQVHAAYYEMGQILSAIAHGKLFKILGYDSLSALIEEELSFSSSQGYKYLHTYRHFNRLGYSKTEALALISDFSFTNMAHYLPGAKAKVGKRAIAAAIDRMLELRRQVNFTLTATELDLLQRALRKFGAEPSEEGRLMGSSDALMRLVRRVMRANGIGKAA